MLPRSQAASAASMRSLPRSPSSAVSSAARSSAGIAAAGGATAARTSRSPDEVGRDPLVVARCRGCTVPDAAVRIAGKLIRQRRVGCAALFGAGRLVDRRADKRMVEPEPLAVDLDEPHGDCRFELLKDAWAAASTSSTRPLSSAAATTSA